MCICLLTLAGRKRKSKLLWSRQLSGGQASQLFLWHQHDCTLPGCCIWNTMSYFIPQSLSRQRCKMHTRLFFVLLEIMAGFTARTWVALLFKIGIWQRDMHCKHTMIEDVLNDGSWGKNHKYSLINIKQHFFFFLSRAMCGQQNCSLPILISFFPATCGHLKKLTSAWSS